MRRRPGVPIQSERTLLALLAEGPSHGYPLADKMGQDHATVYEALTRPEAGGYLKGQWDVNGRRPRRVYPITAKGRGEVARLSR